MTPATVQMQKPVQKKKTQKVVQAIPAPKTNIPEAIIFDSGVLISFTMNGLLDSFRKLKKIFPGKFLITGAIKKEVVETPLKIKRFELEAIKINSLIKDGILEFPSAVEIDDSVVEEEGKEIMDTGNRTFIGEGRDIHLIDIGECTCLALSKMLTKRGMKNVVAVDERTTRMLTEDYIELKNFLQKKLHTKIRVDPEAIKTFEGFKFVRSPELIYVAYKKGLVDIDGIPEELLDALLYGMKFKGAAISDSEIHQIEEMG